MFKLRVFLNSKGNDSIAIIYVSNGHTTYVTFDIKVISRVTQKPLRELYTLSYGEYEI